MGENGFSLKEVELLLLPFYEAMSLPSGDDHCVGLHRLNTKETSCLSPLSSEIVSQLTRDHFDCKSE
jgi:hypothetical protein